MCWGYELEGVCVNVILTVLASSALPLTKRHQYDMGDVVMAHNEQSLTLLFAPTTFCMLVYNSDRNESISEQTDYEGK